MGSSLERDAFQTLYNHPGRVREVERRTVADAPRPTPDAKNILIQPGALPERSG